MCLWSTFLWYPSVTASVSKTFAIWASNISPMTSLRSRSVITCLTTLFTTDQMQICPLWSDLRYMSFRYSLINFYNLVVTKSFTADFTSLAIRSLFLVRWIFTGWLSCSTLGSLLALAATSPYHGSLSSFSAASHAEISMSSLLFILTASNYGSWRSTWQPRDSSLAVPYRCANKQIY